MRDPGGPVLVRRRGNVDGRHKDGEQPGWQSGEHDVSGWGSTHSGYTNVDAAWLAVRAATSPDEPRRDERQRESPIDGATAEETGPQEKIGDDPHPRRVRERTSLTRDYGWGKNLANFGTRQNCFFFFPFLRRKENTPLF